MTELDPSIILHAGDAAARLPRYGDVMEQRAQVQLRNLAQLRLQRADEKEAAALQREQQKLAVRKQIGGKAAQGDYAGADKLALENDEPDWLGTISKLKDNERTEQTRQVRAIVPVAIAALELPDLAARQALALSPQSLAQFAESGMDEAEVRKFVADPNNLSDQALGQMVSRARGYEGAIKQYDESRKPYDLGVDEIRFDGDNKEIARGPAGMQGFAPTENVYLRPGGGQSGGQSPATPNAPYKNGWSPRQRNGGDNTDAQVDNYIGSVASSLGLAPDAPIPPGMIPRLAAAMAQVESGGNPKSLAGRNNNPGNIRNADGSFRKYDTPQQGAAAQTGLLSKYFARGQNTIRSIIEGVPANGGARLGQGGPQQIQQGGDKPQWRQMTPQEAQQQGLPPGNYQVSPEGEIKPVSSASAGTATKQQIGAARQKLLGLKSIKGQIARVDSAIANLERGGWEGPGWGNVPFSGKLDAESAAFDKSVATLTSLIRQLTRTPGEGSMSDYESRLAALIPPARSDKKAARDEAMAGIKELVANIEEGYVEFIGAPPAPPASNSGANNVIRYDANGNRIK